MPWHTEYLSLCLSLSLSRPFFLPFLFEVKWCEWYDVTSVDLTNKQVDGRGWAIHYIECLILITNYVINLIQLASRNVGQTVFCHECPAADSIWTWGVLVLRVCSTVGRPKDHGQCFSCLFLFHVLAAAAGVSSTGWVCVEWVWFQRKMRQPPLVSSSCKTGS